MALTNLINRIQALEVFDLESTVIEIINEYGWYISGLIRLQLQEGKDADGKNVTIFGRDYYSDRTIFDKEHGNYPALGKFTEWITNYRTGRFYSSLVTKAEGKTFKTESDVFYFEEILKRSGEKIIMLNKDHLQQFTKEILIPQIKLRFKALKGGV